MARSTLPSMPRLSEVARHLVYPSTVKSSVFPLVERRLASVGYSFDPWQQGLGTIALGLDSTGRYAATVGGVCASIPRQVGKTYTVGGLLVGLALEFPGLRAIWTSHHLRTTTATFRAMQAIVRRPKILAQLAPNGIRTANGEQEIRFRNGSIIMFGARAQGFGRGMAAIDVEVFDEAQILSLKALEDMVPATNQAGNPHGGLIFFIGTPPRPDDDGEAFTAKRLQALDGNPDDDMVYVELSADAKADPMDRKQWAKANPSYPWRTPLESMLRMRKNVPDDASWRREALGVWDEVTTASSLISESTWSDLSVEDPPADGVPSYGVRFSVDGSRVALAVALRNGEEPVHVEIVRHKTMADGIGWLVTWLEARCRAAGAIVVDGKSDAGALVAALRERRVPARKIVTPSVEQVIAASAMFHEAVKAGSLTHFAQEGLDAAVTHATKRPIGKAGGWGWQGTTDGIDVLPLEAATLAHFGAVTTKRTSANSGGGRRVVVMS